MLQEGLPQADWFTENLQSEVRSLLPRLLDELSVAYQNGTIGSYEKYPMSKSFDSFLACNTTLVLLDLARTSGIAESETYDNISRAFTGTLDTYRQSEMGYNAHQYETYYIFRAKGLSEALSFIDETNWSSPDTNIDPRMDTYEGLINALLLAKRIEEAEYVHSLVTFPKDKDHVGDLLSALGAYEALRTAEIPDWNEFKSRWLGSLGREKALGRYIVREYLRRSVEMGQMDFGVAAGIAHEYGDQEIVLDVEADRTALSLQSGSILSVEKRLFQEWASKHIKESFLRDSFLKDNDLDISGQTYQLCQLAKNFHPMDREFANRFLLEARERAGLAIARSKKENLFRDSLLDEAHSQAHYILSPDFEDLIRVLATALELGDRDLASDIKKQLMTNGIDKADGYWETMADTYLPYNLLEAQYWFEKDWARGGGVPQTYLIRRAVVAGEYKETALLVAQSGREANHFWEHFVPAAAKAGSETWKFALDQLPAALKIFALRNLMIARSRDLWNLPKGSVLAQYMWGYGDLLP